MKGSNVKWIGTIPNDWEIRKVKQCFNISKEPAQQKDPVILSLARSGIKVRDISGNEGQLAASYENYNIVKPGDLLLNPMDLYSGANCNMSEIEGVISPAYVNLRPKIMLNSKFFDYYFKTQYWTMAMFAHGKGVSFDNRWTMNADAILNYFLPFPSIAVQNKIVRYLDQKNQEIDSLIDVEKKQIESLELLKQCEIFEKVTKGLNKNVDLKKTNYWFGSYPKSWKVTELKRLASIQTGSTPPKEKQNIFYSSDCGTPWIKAEDLDSFEPISKTSEYLTEEGSNNGRIFPPHTVFVCCIASVGKTGFSDIECSCNQQLNGITFTGLFWKYGFYLTKAQVNEYNFLATGNVVKILNTERQKYIKCTVPSLDEQIEIAKYLDIKCSDIDRLIDIKEKKIDELEKLKKSIIFECVTGKKKVAA